MDFYRIASALTLLQLRVLLVDDIQTAFPADNLAVSGALFKGCTDFHGAIISCIGTRFDLLTNRRETFQPSRDRRGGF